jgi:hypothetical protein
MTADGTRRVNLEPFPFRLNSRGRSPEALGATIASNPHAAHQRACGAFFLAASGLIGERIGLESQLAIPDIGSRL